MKQVKMLICSAGADEVLKPGDEIALDDHVADAWVSAHLAVYAASPQFEQATLAPVETAALRPARKRKGAK